MNTFIPSINSCIEKKRNNKDYLNKLIFPPIKNSTNGHFAGYEYLFGSNLFSLYRFVRNMTDKCFITGELLVEGGFQSRPTSFTQYDGLLSVVALWVGAFPRLQRFWSSRHPLRIRQRDMWLRVPAVSLRIDRGDYTTGVQSYARETIFFHHILLALIAYQILYLDESSGSFNKVNRRDQHLWKYQFCYSTSLKRSA